MLLLNPNFDFTINPKVMLERNGTLVMVDLKTLDKQEQAKKIIWEGVNVLGTVKISEERVGIIGVSKEGQISMIQVTPDM